MSPKQGYWTNFSPIGIGIMQQVLNSREGSVRLGSHAGRFRDECANNEHHHDNKVTCFQCFENMVFDLNNRLQQRSFHRDSYIFVGIELNKYEIWLALREKRCQGKFAGVGSPGRRRCVRYSKSTAVLGCQVARGAQYLEQVADRAEAVKETPGPASSNA
jgi:hypothetical protein